MCFEVNLAGGEQMVACVLGHRFALCHHHKECSLGKVNLCGVCYDTILCILRVECCAVGGVCMDGLHLCCEMSVSIVNHVCNSALRGRSEHFGGRLGVAVA